MTSIKVKVNNADEVLKELEERIPKALEAIGMQCENYAKMNCPVDTGLLQNLITHALSGQPVQMIYSGDQQGKSGNNPKTGAYSGNAPDDPEDKRAVYVGTNVEYAPYVEYGTQKTDARPFLQPAVEDHADEYKQLAQKALEGWNP